MAMIGESYSSEDGLVRRRLSIDAQAFESTIEDRSNLAPAAPAWSKWWRSWLRGARVRSEVRATGTLTAVDLFCGCGGLALGAQEVASAVGLDLRIRAAVDADADALFVYSLNLRPDRVLGADVTTLVDFQIRGWAEEACFAYRPEVVDRRLRGLVGDVDIVIAGPPCEGHSNLNNRSRRADPRNLLCLDAVAAAVALNASAVVVENVPEIVNDRRRVVDTACALLKSAGYQTCSGVLVGNDLGLAQTRRRFFLVGSKLNLVSIAEITRALGGRGPSDVRWAIEDVVDQGTDPVMDATGQLSAENNLRIAWLFDNGAYDLPNHMRPPCHRDGHTYPSVYGRLRWDAPAGTISTGFMTPGRGRFVHPFRRRTLTAREAARLQGFPDWFLFRRDQQDMPSKKSLSKWIGDAVPPILGYVAVLSILPGFVSGRGEPRGS